MPKISIISGIYNCVDTLSEAIESILSQTVTDWEWILCDDASTDGTADVVRGYQEKYPQRFVLLQNGTNRGLNYTLNRCLKEAKGEYIARMDGDDLCAPERFEKELAVLEAEPEIDIVSTSMTFFDETGTWGRIDHPIYPQKKDFAKESPFCHAPCMVRRRAYEAVNGYSEGKRLLRVEDYHLWYKMYLAGYRGKNIQEPLYRMRDDRNAYRRRRFGYRLNEAYVKLLIVKGFHLPVSCLVYTARPVLVGLLPSGIYDALHKWRLGRKER